MRKDNLWRTTQLILDFSTLHRYTYAYQAVSITKQNYFY